MAVSVVTVIRTIARVLCVALAGAAAGILAILWNDLYSLLPLTAQFILQHPLTWLLLALLPACLGADRPAGLAPFRWVIRAAARAWARLRPGHLAEAVEYSAGRLADLDRRTDPIAARLLGRPLTLALVAAWAVLLLCWAPHYLTWPFWADTEQFAITAQSWSAGILPYRDLADFDFPGPIYLLYTLGSVFGWGRSLPFYAADLALLLLLGVALLAWSRRLFGTMAPGLIGFLPWLIYYLGRDFPHVAQRDWQATALAVLGLLAMESLPGRLGPPFSALGLAAAMAFRPQPVVFVPAFLSAIEESSRRSGKPASHAFRATAAWLAAMVVSLAIVFAPLVSAGVLDDFLGALRIARYGGDYNRTNLHIMYIRSKELFWHDPTRPYVAAALVLLIAFGPADLRRTARTWLLALMGAMCYQAMSPVPHEYLVQPVRLVQSIALAPLSAWPLIAPGPSPSIRLAGVVLVLAMVPAVWPRYCTPRGSLEALGPLARGEVPEKAPPGCASWYPRVGEDDYWDDYRRVLLYLRDEVDRSRPVASLLRSLPIPAVNGPSGHLSPFPAAGGCLHLLLVDGSLEGRFVEALRRTPGTLVVWTPHDRALIPPLKFPRLEEVVLCWYRPIARFGHIQVWERTDE